MSDAWAKKHASYKDQDWIDKPSLFAQTTLGYFPKTGKLLELGAGQGQDSRYFAERGYAVVSTDLEDIALEISRSKLPGHLTPRVTVQKLDLAQDLPFADESFEIVYAHQSLHYFTDNTTKQLFAEIARVLKPSGLLAFLVNAVSDPEYGQGQQIEPDFFQVEDKLKRFFSLESAAQYAKDFEVQLLDNQGETYKDRAKGVHNLIRFIGTKRG